MTASQAPAQPGRRPVTTRSELEQIALELFEKQGFDRTTVDDIAGAAGIGRRTFFRYFPSKNDIPWADFDARLNRLRAWLNACPPETPAIEAIRLAIVDFATLTPEDEVWHRRRTRLILGVPALRAHSTLRFAQWRMVIAEFVARRTGQDPRGLIPQTIGYASLGVDLAAHERWLAAGDCDLTGLVDAAMRGLAAAFAGLVRAAQEGSSSQVSASEEAGKDAAGGGTPPFELAQAQWPAVEKSLRQLLVVPVGSLEQHGPHLPFDTDTRIAVAVARRACVGRPGVALAPPLPVGASGEHAAFPGTLSIGTEALTACLIELGRHASLHWPAMLLVNGHGGNLNAVEAAVGRLRYEGHACVAWHAALPGGDAHAGRAETSIMLALAPGAVRLDAAERGEVRPLDQIMPMLREHGVRAVSPNGVLGDPAGASAGEGGRLLARLVDGLNATMDRFLEGGSA